MNEHLSQERIEDYLERRLDMETLRATEAHLAGCTLCRERLAIPDRQQANATALFAWLNDPLEEEFHLSDSLIGDFVDGKLDEVDRETLLSHIELLVVVLAGSRKERDTDRMQIANLQTALQIANKEAERQALLERTERLKQETRTASTLAQATEAKRQLEIQTAKLHEVEIALQDAKQQRSPTDRANPARTEIAGRPGKILPAFRRRGATLSGGTRCCEPPTA